MKKTLFISSIIMAITCLGVGSEGAVDWSKKVMVSVSGGMTSPGHVATSAWVQVHQKDTGSTWRVVGAAATAERIYWLISDKAQIYYRDMHSFGQDIVVGEGYESDKSGQSHLRLAIFGFPQWWGMCAFADSGIKSIKDIKPGTTYVVPVAATTTVHFYQAFRRYLNMTEKELIMVGHASFPGAYRAFAQGQAKLIASSPDGPTTLEWMSSPHGLVYLDWPEDKEAEKRFAEWLPDVPFGKAQRGPKEFLGIRMPVNYWSASSLASLDTEVVYEIVKWMDTNYNRLKDLTPECKDMTLAYLREALDYAYVPVHDGLIRYLKEKGMWSAADDTRNRYNIWLNDKYVEVYKNAMKMAQEKGWQIAPDNKEWVQFWKDFRKKEGLPSIRIMTNEEIASALKTIK